jgi:hypothetical protein
MKNKAAIFARSLVLPALLTTLNPQLSTAFAQGTAFTYQGRLNSGGASANGLFDFRFRLDADPVGNVILGTAFTNAVAVANGLFTTTIDFGASQFTGSNLWLEVDVKTNLAGSYTVLAPLQAFMPTPYAVFANTAGNVSGMVPAAQLTGTVLSAQLGGTYFGAVNLTNAGNSFAGSGANVTGVNAARLNGLSATNFWQLGGNNGTTPGVNFLGTADDQPMELWANNSRALRLEPGSGAAGAPNMIGGSPVNFVAAGVAGATIGGGGASYYPAIDPLPTSFTNSVASDWGTIGGGEDNQIQGTSAAATIGGGKSNHIQAGNLSSTIGGGQQNQILANAYASTIGGGNGNEILPDVFQGTVGGGAGNSVGGYYATVPGGLYNHANGYSSFAAGQQAQALHQGAFVWADSQNAVFTSTTNDEFSLRAQNGVHIQSDAGIHLDALNTPIIVRDFDVFANTATNSKAGIGRWGLFMEPYNLTLGVPNMAGRYFQVAKYSTNGGATQLLQVDQSGNVIAQGTVTAHGVLLTSDRNAKENFAALDPRTVLAKVAALPVTEWNYKTDDASQKHIGPMAQDFQAAFQLSADDKHISVVDEGGVALAAIQGLHQQLEEQKVENAELKAQLAELKTLVNQLAQARVK